MPKITEEFASDIRNPASGQTIFRDDQLTGFGLRVTPSRKSFIVETRVSGKVKRITLGQHGFMSADKARLEAHKLLSNVSAGRGSRIKGAPTLQQVLDAYIEKRTLRPRTITTYEKAIRLHMSDWLLLPVTEITEDMVMSRHKELGTKFKGNTANGATRTLRSLLYFAAENYKTVDGKPIISANPVSKISRTHSWYRKDRRHSVIPEHQLADWYKASMAVTGGSHNVADYLLVLILTGLRRNEAATLKWSDIDFDARILTIRREIAKNHREHQLPLSNFLMVLLRRRRQDHPDAEYVFPGQRSGHMSTHLGYFDKVEKLSGVKFMLHDCRRSFVSMAAKLGVPHHLTKKLLNHVGDKDEHDEYIVISTEHLREPMERITQKFIELMELNPADWQKPDLIEERAKYKLATVTLGEIIEHYLEVKKLGDESQRAYRKVVMQRLADFADTPVAHISPEMVLDKYRQLCTVDGICKASKIQAGFAMRVLKTLLNFAATNYKVDGKPVVLVNPVRAIKEANSWNERVSPKGVIGDDQLPAFYQALKSLKGNNAREMLLLMLHMGLTKAAAQRICWSDIDFKKRVVTVRSQGKELTLPMSNYVFKLLNQRRSYKRSEFVFPGRTKHLDRLTEVLNHMRQKSGCQFSIDDLKRTHLRIADELGLAEIALQHLCFRWQGSKNVIWNRLDVERLREPMEKVSNRLAELMEVDICNLA